MLSGALGCHVKDLVSLVEGAHGDITDMERPLGGKEALRLEREAQPFSHPQRGMPVSYVEYSTH